MGIPFIAAQTRTLKKYATFGRMQEKERGTLTNFKA